MFIDRIIKKLKHQGANTKINYIFLNKNQREKFLQADTGSIQAQKLYKKPQSLVFNSLYNLILNYTFKN